MRHCVALHAGRGRASRLAASAVPRFAMARLHYELPAPFTRGASRLLVVRPSGPMQDAPFRALESFLPPQSHLLLNDSQVLYARLWASPIDTRGADEGERVEVLLLSPAAADPDPDRAHARGWRGQRWRALLRCCVAAGDHVQVRVPLEGPRSTAWDRFLLKVVATHAAWAERGHEPVTEAVVQFESDAGAWTTSGDVQGLSLGGLLALCGAQWRQDTVPEDWRADRTTECSEDHLGSGAAPTPGLPLTADQHEGRRGPSGA